MRVRPYDDDRDREPLWELKRSFERGLGAGTGSDEKEETYAAKLTESYRRRYLDWVGRCTERDERCVTVADPGEGLAGYVFVLPDDCSMIWDAAVLNEVYVREAHRGTGVADELMDAAVDLAAEQDLPLDRLVLDVDRENGRAKAFYRRHGFEHWGEMVSKSLDG